MRIGLLRKQQPFAEFDQRTQRWRVWYIYNNDVTSGTYYELSPNGICDRVTTSNGNIVSVDRVDTPPSATVEDAFKVYQENNSMNAEKASQLMEEFRANNQAIRAVWQDNYER